MLVQEVASQFGSFLTYRKVTVLYSDLTTTTGGTAQTLSLGGLGGVTSGNALSNVNSGNLVIPAGYWLVGVRMKVTALFTGGSMATLTASVGTASGSGTNLIAASDVLGCTVGTVYSQAASVITTANAITNLPAFTPVVVFTPTTYALSALTAGQLDIELIYTNISTAGTTATSGAPSQTIGV